MTMVTASKLNEFNQAEAPARLLLERLDVRPISRSPYSSVDAGFL